MKILVPYDGSENAKNAVKEAVDLAKQFSGLLTVLHVQWDPLEETYAEEVEKYEGIEVRDEVSLRLLDDLDPMLEESGVKYDLRSETTPRIPKTILSIAEDEGYDLICIGSRGMGSAKAWLLGSVSNRVITGADCPVLVVHRRLRKKV